MFCGPFIPEYDRMTHDHPTILVGYSNIYKCRTVFPDQNCWILPNIYAYLF